MATDLLERSKHYIIAGEFEKAQIVLRRILNDNPNQAKALELSGDLAQRMGKNKEAAQRYDHASTNYTQENKYAEAIICLEKVLKIDKKNEDAFARLADLYRFYGLPNSAINTILDLCSWAVANKEDAIFVSGLRKIVELQPKNLHLRLSFIKILLSIKRTQEAEDELKKLKPIAEEARAEDILEEINKLLPQHDGGEELDPKSRIELGNLLYEIGSKDEAIVEFEKAVSDLIDSGENEDALKVLNRIIEIDPSNANAINKIKELKGEHVAGKPVEEKAEEEISTTITADEIVAEAPEEVVEAGKPEEKTEQIEAPAEADIGKKEADATEGLEMFEDLKGDIEGFIPATETGPAEAPSEAEFKPEDLPHLEGQIADIEFLLKEAEAPTAPSFEVAKEFDDFRNSIEWQTDDDKKRLTLAKMAFDAGLYDNALVYIRDIKDKKETWPLSLEINGGSLLKLGRYSDAMKALAPSLLHEEIAESEKLELRYLLASSYEGLGDFDNAMREVERIISINPNYKDVKEMYALMGGKKVVYKEPEIAVEEKPLVRGEIAPAPPSPKPQPVEPEPAEIKSEQVVEEVPPATERRSPEEAYSRTGEQFPEEYPTIVEEMPHMPQEKIPKKTPEEMPDVGKPKEDNIAFL